MISSRCSSASAIRSIPCPVLLGDIVRSHVCLAEDLGRDRALRGIAQHAGDRIGVERAPPPLRLMIWSPIRSNRRRTSSRASLLGLAVARRHLERLRAHRRAADHPGRPPRDALDVAADAARVLAVEDALGRHRAERVDDVREHLVLEREHPVFLLDHPVVATGLAALLDRETRRLGALHVEVTGDCVPGLVDRDGALLDPDVLGADRRAGVERRQRLDEVVPAERRRAPSWCAIVSAIEIACSIIAGE